MSEMNNATVGGPQLTPPDSGLQQPLLRFHFRPWERRMLRPFMILYFNVGGIYAIAMLVPALGQWHLRPDVTFETSAKVVFYGLLAALILRFFVPAYWDALRTPSPAWWLRSLVIGMQVMVVGIVISGVMAFVHETLGDTLAFPLYISGLALSGIGLLVFTAGLFGEARATLRQQRAVREAAYRRVTPPAQ